MLNAIVEHVPEIYNFCHLAYDVSSALKFFNHTVSSQEGVQQGDPLGPLLFCLPIHTLLLACQSQLKMAYIDDITLGGPAAVVAADDALVKAQGTALGLVLNEKKCETIATDGHTDEISLQQFIHHTPLSSTLLGAPLLQGPAMNDCQEKRCSDLDRAIPRLDPITSHDALVLLRASFSAPALQHSLRASPCNGHEALTQINNLVRIALFKICNLSLMINGYRPAYVLNLADWVFALHHWHHQHAIIDFIIISQLVRKGFRLFYIWTVS